MRVRLGLDMPADCVIEATRHLSRRLDANLGRINGLPIQSLNSLLLRTQLKKRTHRDLS